MIDGIIPYDWKSMKAPIESEDKRIASMIRDIDSFEDLKSGDIVIIGIPQDFGVARNGGRIGASKAPFKIREYLGKLPIHGIEHFPYEIYDLGNIICEGRTLEDIRIDHHEILRRILETGAIPVILGGGHDIAFPNAKALLDTHEPIGIINIDPHLDVRVKIDGLSHSGTPFREMLEYKKPDMFIEFGTQTFAASTHHREFVQEQGGNILSYAHLRSVGNPSNQLREILKSMKHEEMSIYVSFDMDAVSSAFAPGVSAPATIGFTSDEITEMAYWAGAEQVKMIDIVEVNPVHDIDDRTSRLAALMIAHFIAGYTSGS